MSYIVRLSSHAIERIKHGDRFGRRTRLSTEEVVQILRNSRLFVPFYDGDSQARVFYSVVDNKCLVAWILVSCGVIMVKTVDNHRNRIPARILLLAEQYVLGNVVFVRHRFPDGFHEREYEAECCVGEGGPTITLSGYAYPGISWWRFEEHVKSVARFVRKYDLEPTEELLLKGSRWDMSKRRFALWEDRLPASFPEDLLITAEAGNLPDIITRASLKTVIGRHS